MVNIPFAEWGYKEKGVPRGTPSFLFFKTCNRGRLGDFSSLAEVAQYGVVAAVVKIRGVAFPPDVLLVGDFFERLIGRFDRQLTAV